LKGSQWNLKDLSSELSLFRSANHLTIEWPNIQSAQRFCFVLRVEDSWNALKWEQDSSVNKCNSKWNFHSSFSWSLSIGVEQAIFPDFRHWWPSETNRVFRLNSREWHKIGIVQKYQIHENELKHSFISSHLHVDAVRILFQGSERTDKNGESDQLDELNCESDRNEFGQQLIPHSARSLDQNRSHHQSMKPTLVSQSLSQLFYSLLWSISWLSLKLPHDSSHPEITRTAQTVGPRPKTRISVRAASHESFS
jgi:hypothetical protein